MFEVLKILGYLSGGFILSYLSIVFRSTFLSSFTEDIINLLITIFAINIASTSIIISSIKDISEISGHDFSKSKKHLRLTIVYQIVMIFLVFIILIFKKSEVVQIYFGTFWTDLIANGIIVSAFLYYVDIVIDLGRALISIMNFKK